MADPVTLSAGAYLGGAGIGALGSIVSGVGGGLLNALSAETAYHHQRDLMNLQAKLNLQTAKKSTLNQYMWQRKGLENANFNPMLAWQGAEGVANTGWTAGHSVQPADFSGIIPNATSVFDQWQKLQVNREQVRNLGSQTELNEATADTERSKITLNNAESMLKMLQTEGQTIENRLKNVDLDWREVNYYKDYLKTLSDIERNTVQNSTDMLNAQANYNSVQGQLQLWNKQKELLTKQGILNDTQVKQIEASMKGMTFDQIKDTVKSLGSLVLILMFTKGFGGANAGAGSRLMLPTSGTMSPLGVPMNFNIKPPMP